MAMIMSDLLLDLVEEVLIRVPLTSLGAVRLTCKKWNHVCKDGSFIKKHIGEAKKKQVNESEMITMMDHKVYLVTVDLHSNVDPSITLKSRLFRLKDNNANQVDNVFTVFHCDGLLLCITKDPNSRLVVWNPYFGQITGIQPRSRYHIYDSYALGYDEKKHYKLFRYVDPCFAARICEFELYSFESNSWKVVVDVSSFCGIEFIDSGLSVKGNTYWYAKRYRGEDDVNFLICFDFTTERFGPRLPLPFNVSPSSKDIVTLSSVGEEQFAVMFQDDDTLRMEIWVTSKVEPTEVLWNKLFLAVDMTPFIGSEYMTNAGSFFIDLKKNVAVVFECDLAYTRSIAYIIGNEGYFKKVDLGEYANVNCFPLVCSYVPSTVQI